LRSWTAWHRPRDGAPLRVLHMNATAMDMLAFIFEPAFMR